MDKIQEFRKIVGEMADTYEKKNENYGDSFGQLCKDLGPVAGLVPLYNKIHRATSLVKSGKNHYENLEDTFIDLACYAIMNVIEMRANDEKKCQTYEGTAPNIIIRRDLYDYGITTLEYKSPCIDCVRNTEIGACDGCRHNIVLTNGGNN